MYRVEENIEKLCEKYEGIVRKDGYYIRPMIQRIRAVQMDILKAIDGICIKHNLKWFVDWGTLLGAVREHGYISWDDDLDISMGRVDFELFKRYASEELPEAYNCYLERGDNLRDLVFCINNGRGVNTETEYLVKNHGCPYSVGVDIFVYDNVPDDLLERDNWLTMFSYTFAAAQEMKADELYEDCGEEIKSWIAISERMTGITLDKSKPLKSTLVTLADQIAAMYYTEKEEYVAIVGYLPLGEKYLFENRWIEQTIRVPFENLMVAIPKGYKEILTRWYGEDYMIPKEYHEHDSDVLRQERMLHEWYRERGMEIPVLFQE